MRRCCVSNMQIFIAKDGTGVHVEDRGVGEPVRCLGYSAAELEAIIKPWTDQQRLCENDGALPVGQDDVIAKLLLCGCFDPFVFKVQCNEMGDTLGERQGELATKGNHAAIDGIFVALWNVRACNHHIAHEEVRIRAEWLGIELSFAVQASLDPCGLHDMDVPIRRD